MLLPCPHCRRRFSLGEDRIPSARARLQCPACGGVFGLSLSSPGPETNNDTEPMDSRVRGNDCGTAPSTTQYGGQERSRLGFLLFWTLVPSSCLLLALAGILLSGPWGTEKGPRLSSLPSAEETEQALSSSVSSNPDASSRPEAPSAASALSSARPEVPVERQLMRAFWSSGSHVRDACERLPPPPAGPRETGDENVCGIYPAWITYLVLETTPTPVCALEPTFTAAAEDLQNGTLCAPGYAFLSFYYLEKGLLDRSQSFLDQALEQDRDDPWVRLAEAVFYEQAYYDDRKAIHILEGVKTEHPSFSLARYVLGRGLVREEAYGRANAAFASLKEETKGQIAFWRIRRALSALETGADPGEEKAEALLALSRSFTSLKDYTMAQDLYRWILDDMQESLPREEQRAAFCELGGLYETKGDKSSAYDAYRSALEIDPDFPPARDRIQGLLSSQPDSS